jgi:hypothetical protein
MRCPLRHAARACFYEVAEELVEVFLDRIGVVEGGVGSSSCNQSVKLRNIVEFFLFFIRQFYHKNKLCILIYPENLTSWWDLKR